MLKKNLIIFFSVALIFFIDRISKILVISKSEKLNQNEIFSTKFINFHLIWNEGIAFGLLSFSNSSTYQIMTLFILLVILILIFYMFKTDMVYEKIGFSHETSLKDHYYTNQNERVYSKFFEIDEN